MVDFGQPDQASRWRILRMNFIRQIRAALQTIDEIYHMLVTLLDVAERRSGSS
jgi:hypothetical protein